MGRTLFDKIWDSHVVRELDDGSTLVYVDQRVSARAYRQRSTDEHRMQTAVAVRNPAHVFATMDHIIDTFPGRGDSQR